MYEVIISNMEEGILAEINGMDRVEFAVDMTADGLSPEIEKVKEVTSRLKIPVHVMVRFNSESFHYGETEFQHMLNYIVALKSTNTAGIVWGGLINKAPNYKQIEMILKIWDRKFTFHRAFEHCENLEMHYKNLTDLPIDHILTSGGNQLMKSLETLDKLYKISCKKLLIGGGVSLDNLLFLMKRYPDAQYHLGRGVRKDESWDRELDSTRMKQILELRI
ncbi:MAG: hypothetical protein JXR88_09855 [Clostridia bacterium]|nr:hypothetical protein [Clostridia bacterium]